MLLDRGLVVRLLAIGDDVDDGVGLDEAGARIYGTDGPDGGDGGTDELPLQPGATSLSVRVEGTHVAAHPGPEGYFVYRAEEGNGIRVVLDHGRSCVCEGGEAIDELRGEDVEGGREAPMAEVPDNLGSGGGASVEHG